MKKGFLSNIKWRWTMRYDPGCYRALATAYWRFLIRALVLSSLASVVFGGWLLWSGLPEPSYGEMKGGSTETLSRQKLKQVLDAFKQRELKYAEIAKTPQAIVDPSKSTETKDTQAKH